MKAAVLALGKAEAEIELLRANEPRRSADGIVFVVVGGGRNVGGRKDYGRSAKAAKMVDEWVPDGTQRIAGGLGFGLTGLGLKAIHMKFTWLKD